MQIMIRHEVMGMTTKKHLSNMKSIEKDQHLWLTLITEAFKNKFFDSA